MRAFFVLPLLGALAALPGCITNPATGGSTLAFGADPQAEIETGRKAHPEILKEFGGAYPDPALQAYVDAGADWLMVGPVDSSDPDNARILGEEILPRLR